MIESRLGAAALTEAARNLVSFATDEELKALMLVFEFGEEAILELGQGLVLVPGNGHGGGLVASRVDFDLMLEGVVVEII